MLVDVLTKQPVTDAVILCNGKQNPYVTKDDGYYVFCNLYPGNYNIYIAATGYVNKEFSTNIGFGESKKFILELSFKSKNPALFNVPRMEFLIKKDDLPLKNTEIKITLKTEVKTMKLIQQINPGDQEILLNIPENAAFSLQRYIYSVPRKFLKWKKEEKKSDKDEKKDDDEEDNEEDDEESEEEEKDNEEENDEESDDEEENDEESDDEEDNEEDNEEDDEESEEESYEESKKESEKEKEKEKKEKDKNETNDKEEKSSDKSGEDSEKSEFITQDMMFLGYDRKFNAYILEKEVTTDVPIGGSFFPYWNLKTDNYGKLILPFLQKLMIGTKLEFEISADEQKKLVKANFNKFDVKQKKLSLKVKI